MSSTPFDWKNYFTLNFLDAEQKAEASAMLDEVSRHPAVRTAIQNAHQRALTRIQTDTDIIKKIGVELQKNNSDPSFQKQMAVLNFIANENLLGNRAEWLELAKAGNAHQIPTFDASNFRITISDQDPPISEARSPFSSATPMVDWIKLNNRMFVFKGADGQYHEDTLTRSFIHELGHFLDPNFSTTFSAGYRNIPEAAATCDLRYLVLRPNIKWLPGETLDQFLGRVDEALNKSGAVQKKSSGDAADMLRQHDVESCVTEKVFPLFKGFHALTTEIPAMEFENKTMQLLDPTSVPRVDYLDTYTKPGTLRR